MLAVNTENFETQKNFHKAYGCIQTDHTAAVKSWQGHQQHFLRNRPWDSPGSGH